MPAAAQQLGSFRNPTPLLATHQFLLASTVRGARLLVAEPYARPLALPRWDELDPRFLEDDLNLLERGKMGTEAILKSAYRVGR